jgi:NAD(P)-dependent dehydrogenase (short-subunit alcohol dehydrogenase family)
MPRTKPLEGKIALVAGATRGAGRGIACMLGEAGATVYCTGRSVRGRPNMTGYFAGRPENIDETAEMVTERGGVGIPVRVDHLIEKQVAALVERISAEQGQLDVLVNDISEGDVHEWKPFWKLSLDRAFGMFRNGVHSHIITCRHAVPLMIGRRRSSPGLIVEIGDGDTLGYRGNLFYDLIKITVSRLAYAMAEELYKHRVAAIAVTPGYMRTETILENYGVTEANWRDGAKKDPNFIASETPFFVGRAVAALAADPNVMEKSGGLFGSWTLSDEYGFTDMDGRRPHLGRHIEEALGGFGGPSKTSFRWTLMKAPSKRPAAPKRRAKAKA